MPWQISERGYEKTDLFFFAPPRDTFQSRTFSLPKCRSSIPARNMLEGGGRETRLKRLQAGRVCRVKEPLNMGSFYPLPTNQILQKRRRWSEIKVGEKKKLKPYLFLPCRWVFSPDSLGRTSFCVAEIKVKAHQIMSARAMSNRRPALKGCQIPFECSLQRVSAHRWCAVRKAH